MQGGAEEKKENKEGKQRGKTKRENKENKEAEKSKEKGQCPPTPSTPTPSITVQIRTPDPHTSSRIYKMLALCGLSVEPKVRLQGYGYNPFCSHSFRCLAVLV